MELKVKFVKEVTVNEEKRIGIPKFTTVMESKGTTIIVREKEECSFTPGDRWELKRVENQTTLHG